MLHFRNVKLKPFVFRQFMRIDRLPSALTQFLYVRELRIPALAIVAGLLGLAASVAISSQPTAAKGQAIANMPLDSHAGRLPTARLPEDFLLPPSVTSTSPLAKTHTIASMPLAAWIMTSGFGMRFHPLLRTMRYHDGIDLAAAIGTPILASQSGIVRTAGWQGGYGIMVGLEHGAGIETRYGHMSRLAVAPGQSVQKGEIIGYVGSTGLSTGPHLHYEVRLNGQPVNPLWNTSGQNIPKPYLFSGNFASPLEPLPANSGPQLAVRSRALPKPTGSPILTAERVEPGLTIATPSPANRMAHSSLLFLGVDEKGPSGRWAVDALRMCAGLKGCRLVAYGSTDQIERNRGRAPDSIDRPLHIFVRDEASGMELALWDCKRVERPSSQQCMPEGGAELRRLLSH